MSDQDSASPSQEEPSVPFHGDATRVPASDCVRFGLIQIPGVFGVVLVAAALIDGAIGGSGMPGAGIVLAIPATFVGSLLSIVLLLFFPRRNLAALAIAVHAIYLLAC